MELKRRLSLVVAIMSIALGSGHLVQNVLAKPKDIVTAEARINPVDITLVAAGSDVVLPDLPTVVAKLPAPSFAANPAEELPSIFSLPQDPLLEAGIGQMTPGTALASAECVVSLDLSNQGAAMIGLTLNAPCRANERVVLRHAGLAVTGKISAAGILHGILPAMKVDGKVSVLFRDGQTFMAEVAIPEAANVRRFGVQWMGNDAFQLHAFENGSDYGLPGHVSAADPHRIAIDAPEKGGYLSVLGDDQVDLPMLAEVYTYPATSDIPVRIVVESAVTKTTCARDLLGETLAGMKDKVMITELTVSMPNCSMLGDILVLKNLDPDLLLAAAN